MDKETLSNYGWVVICVLVLVVMIALATPFGQFIATAVKNTTKGMFDVSQKALNTGLSAAAGVTIATPAEIEFEVVEGNTTATEPGGGV